jgi:hypothetical protein
MGGIPNIRQTSLEFGYGWVKLSHESDPHLSSLLVDLGLASCSQEPSSYSSYLDVIAIGSSIDFSQIRHP